MLYQLEQFMSYNGLWDEEMLNYSNMHPDLWIFRKSRKRFDH